MGYEKEIIGRKYELWDSSAVLYTTKGGND